MVSFTAGKTIAQALAAFPNVAKDTSEKAFVSPVTKMECDSDSVDEGIVAGPFKTGEDGWSPIYWTAEWHDTLF